MKINFALIACATGLCGCASTGSIPHLSDHRCQQVDTAADKMAMIGGVLPDAIEKLNPVQVYVDHGNIVIAMLRNADGEQGFYIIPTMSSYDPRYTAHPGWTFSPVNPSDLYLNNMFVYSRK